MLRILNIYFIICIFSFASFSPLESDSKTNVVELNRLSEQLFNSYTTKHAEAIEIAERLDLPVKRTFADGSEISLQFFSDLGRPLFYKTNNIIAGETISTDEVWSGGNAGLSLDGSGMTLHEWDAGMVRTTHVEFNGRVTIGDAGNTILHSHSTHVAGTMIAAGEHWAAIGMATAADLIDFDWDNDTGEMASEAAGGALLSNHSYGFVSGWEWNYFDDDRWIWAGDISVSASEDHYFGFYSSYSQIWDQIAYNAPYFLICKSAGNDRNDNGPPPGTEHWVWDGEDFILSSDTRDPDGQYDCIASKGVAKNILTVGAVEDISGGYTGTGSVIATSFTSWGPADDGRIKPDIAANGRFLWSTLETADDAYGYKSGTSMSCPSVAGSACLLQQHYNNFNSAYMLSSTLKGLIIHTADEAGPDPGPDYMFGWGLMNTETAADVITNNGITSIISEETLSNGETFELDLTSLGTQPLVITICWTDIPGTPPADAVDPTNKMLVSDLDLRVSNDRETAYPWKLDLNNPENAAINNGDNDVDNVEKVEILSPSVDEWTISVTHKGILSTPQDFSIIVTGVVVNPPNISVDPILIEVALLPDATKTETFRISNTGTGVLHFECLLNYLMRSDEIEENKLIMDLSSSTIELLPESIELIPTIEMTSNEIPKNRDDIELNYDNNSIGTYLGTGGNYWWTCAVRFTSDELSLYYGSYAIDMIKVLIGAPGESENFTYVALKIWEGGSLGDAGNLVYYYEATDETTMGVWLEHELEYPIHFHSGNEYWIGYSIETPVEGGFPSVVDSGPVVSNKGDWLDWGNSDNWGALGWDKNFMIRCFITSAWLQITSNDTGEIAAPGREFLDVELLFDSSTFTAGETKTANIHIFSNDPYSLLVSIPVTMNVVESIPDPPVIQSITVIGNDVLINWESVPGALSYSIYSDTDPYGNFSTLEASEISSTNWTDLSAAGDKKFYIIITNY